MIFSNKLLEKTISALAEENERLRRENTKLNDKLLSFCSEAFSRYFGIKLQDKQLDVVKIKNTLMEQLGANEIKSKEEEKEMEEAEMVLNHTLGVI